MRLVCVSGFGPFESFEVNPSGALAQSLEADPPRGIRVSSAVLPVSFARAPAAFDQAFAAERPALFLGLGVASRETGFRLERRAGPRLKRVRRPDVDGRLPSEFSAEGPLLESGLDLARLLGA